MPFAPVSREIKLIIGGSVHDPSDLMGKLLFNVLAIIDKFEAELISMRTREGMKVAKVNSRLWRKQPKLTYRRKPSSLNCTTPANIPWPK